jgi:hypothetical protein
MAISRILLGALCALMLASLSARAADPFTVKGIHVDATGTTATEARNKALAMGRPLAWTKLYRSLVPQAAWGKQPKLNDFQLQHIIRSFEVANERRSNTRYIADLTYIFSPNEVRKLLRGTGAQIAEAANKPVLVIPLVGGSYNPNGAWARAWQDPAVGSLMPMTFPRGEPGENALIARGNFGALTWDSVAALARRHEATGVVIAEATANGQSARLTELYPPAGRTVGVVAVARADFNATALAAARKLAESWRERGSINYAAKLRLTADVEFSSPADWARIRARLALVKLITATEVNGIALREARVRIVHYGRTEQLAAAMSAQQLELVNEGNGAFRLRLRSGAPAAPQEESPVPPG